MMKLFPSMAVPPALVFLLGPLVSLAAEGTWLGNSSSNWAQASNWEGGVLPEPGGDLVISDFFVNHLVLDQSRTVGLITFGETGEMVGSTGDYFHISTNGNGLADPVLGIHGGVVAKGAFSAAQLVLRIQGNILIAADQEWEVGGALGSVESDRGLAITRDGASGVGRLVLNGDLTKVGPGQLTLLATTVSGAGDIIVNEGALKLNQGFNSLLTVGGEGLIRVNNNAQIWFSKNSGNLDFQRTIEMNDHSTMVLGGGTTTRSETIAGDIVWNGDHDLVSVNNNSYLLAGNWHGAGSVHRATGTPGAIFSYAGDNTDFTGELILAASQNILSGDFGACAIYVDAGTAVLSGNFTGTAVSSSNGHTSLDGNFEGASFEVLNGTTTAGGTFVNSPFSVDGGVVNVTAPEIQLASLTWGEVHAGTALVTSDHFVQADGDLYLTVGGDASGKLVISGNAEFLGTGEIWLEIQGNPDGKSFEIMTVGGTLTGTPTIRYPESRANGTLQIENGKVTMSFTGGPANLVWTGADTNFWNVRMDQNFLHGAEPDWFVPGDNVQFRTPGAGGPAIDVQDDIDARVVGFEGDWNWSLTGQAKLTGGTQLKKEGAGTLTLANAGPNDFSGGVTVHEGVLLVKGSNLLGKFGSEVRVKSGATLDLAGNMGGDVHFFIEGEGHQGLGALTNRNDSNPPVPAGSMVTLTGDAVLSNSGVLGNWSFGPSPTNPNAYLDLAGHRLTKRGDRQLNLSGSISAGDLLVEQGMVLINAGTATTAPGTIITVNSGASLGYSNANNPGLQGQIVMSGGVLNAGTASTIGSDLVLKQDTTFGGTGSLTVNGKISESGGSYAFEKTGTSTFLLAGANSFSGTPIVRDGVVRLANPKALGMAGTVIVDNAKNPGGLNNTDLYLNGGGVFGEGVNLILRNSSVANIPNARSRLISEIYDTTWAGTITLEGGMRQSLYSSSGIFTITGDLVQQPGKPSSELLIRGVQAGTGVITGHINLPNLNMFKTDGGTWVIASSGNVWGPTLVALGTLRMGATQAVPPATLLTMGQNDNGAAVWDLAGYDQTIGGLSNTGTGTRTITNSATTKATLTIDQRGDNSYAGVIADGNGPLALVKKGNYDLVLAGANSYTGDTTVSQGMLTLTQPTLSASSSVRFGSNALLRLLYNAATPITVSALYVNGSAVAPGTYTSSAAFIHDGSTGSLIVTGTGGGSAYETWAAAHAGGQGPGEDFNQDGIPNGLAFFLGLEGGQGNPLPVMEDGSVRWPMNPDFDGSFEVQVSNNLKDWRPAESRDVAVQPGVSVTLSVPEGRAPYFVRLKVTVN